MTESPRSLHERLLECERQIVIKKTGKTAPNAGSQKTFSIQDVENAIDDLFVKNGILSDYTAIGPPTLYEPFGVSAKFAMWGQGIKIRIWNADQPTESIEADSYDVGNSPSAAVSYALKRYYKALFHIADEKDERRNAGEDAPEPTRPAPRQVPVTPPPAPAPASKPVVVKNDEDPFFGTQYETSGEVSTLEDLITLASTLPAEAMMNEIRLKAMVNSGAPMFSPDKVKEKIMDAHKKFGTTPPAA